MKHTRFIITSVATLLLMSMLVICASAAGVPVTDVNQAVPGLSASAIAAETDSPEK